MQALREREAVLRSMVDLGADWYWEQDAQFRFRSTPFGALDAVRPDALGRTRWELECTGDIPPERWAEHRARLERHERFQDFEYRTPLADGKLHWVSVSGMPIFDADGSFAGYRGVSKIITARKDAEQRLRTALREKEILLKEIYHRVKNNLQVVTSLLSLQGQRTTDERARALLQDSANRVESIALVHAQLYRSGDLSNIDMREYLPQLVAALAEAHALSGRRVALHVEADGVALGIETAVPLGLIVNELVSNAFKHAFAGDGGGALTVTLRQVDAQHCEFAVADDGRGLPAGFDPTRLRSLGMQLVVSLAEQLEGTLDFGACGSAGTCVRVRFRPEQPERMRLATIL
jgi:PAS domain S-box-containing protein